jgi:ATP synthase protein I
VVTPKPDDRSALSIGLDWGTRITSIGLEFAVPAFLGFGLDRWWHTGPWLTILGSLLGLVVGMLHLVRLAATLSRSGPTGRGGGPLDAGRGPGTSGRENHA